MKTNKLFFSGITLGLSIASIMGLASIFKTKQYIAPFEIKENVEATDEVFSKDKPSIIGGYIGEKNLINKRLKNEEDNLTKPKIGYQMAYGTKDDGTKTVSIRYTAAISSLDVDSATWTRAMYEENGDAYSRLKEASKEVTTAYTGLTNNGKVTYATSVEDDLGNKPFNYYVVYTLLEIPLESYGTYYLDASLTITKNGKSITSTVGAVEINNQNMFSYERGSNDYINYELDTGSKTYNVYGNQDKKSTPIEELVIPGYYNNGQGRYKVNNIKDNAFDGFDDVDYFDIPDVEYMGSGVFNNSKGKLLCRGNKKHDNWKDDWNSNNNSTSWNYIGIYGVKDNIVYTICRDENRSIYSTAIGYTSNLLDKATISSFLLIPTREIGDYCFYGNSEIKEVTLPTSVKTLGNYAFQNSTIESINLESVEFVGKYCFYKCSYLKNIGSFNYIKTIKNYAFASTPISGDLYLPNTIERIEILAFGWTSLNSLYVPESLQYAGPLIFGHTDGVLFIDEKCDTSKWDESFCQETKTVYGVINNELKQTEDGLQYTICNYNGEKYISIVKFLIKDYVDELVIPEYIDGIKVKNICYDAFEGSKIKKLIISDNVELDRECFLYSTINELVLPNTLTKLEEYTFDYINSLQELIIPNSVTEIETSAIMNCYDLKKIYIPASVSSIKNSFVLNCDKVKIYCELETKPSGWANNWNNNIPVIWSDNSSNELIYENFSYKINSVFDIIIYNYYGKDEQVVIPTEINGLIVKEIKDYCFYGNSEIKEVTLPTSVKTLGNYAFQNSTIESINLESVEFVGKYCFYKCSYLKNIGSFNYIKTIKNYAFASTPISGDLYLPNTIERIEILAFGWTSLNSLYVPESLQYAGPLIFGHTDGVLFIDEKCDTSKWDESFCQETKTVYGVINNELKQTEDGLQYTICNYNGEKYISIVKFLIKDYVDELVIPEYIDGIKVKNICYDAFEGSKIKKLIISDNVELDRECFLYSTINELVLPNTLTKLEEYTFDYINSLQELIIPNSVTEIETSAIMNCYDLKKIYIPASVSSIKNSFVLNCDKVKIYCELETKPSGWANNWNNNVPVIWGCKSLLTD